MPKHEKVITTSRIYSGYRISLIKIKDLLDIEPGDSIKIIKRNGEIVLRKVEP